MPGFNRKGPQDEGPMTGRGLGRCANKGEIPSSRGTGTEAPKSQPTQENDETLGGFGRRRGMGRRNGQGRGFRNRG